MAQHDVAQYGDEGGSGTGDVEAGATEDGGHSPSEDGSVEARDWGHADGNGKGNGERAGDDANHDPGEDVLPDVPGQARSPTRGLMGGVGGIRVSDHGCC